MTKSEYKKAPLKSGRIYLWENQEDWDKVTVRIHRLLQFYHKIWEINHRV
jgi:hypothetical protein